MPSSRAASRALHLAPSSTESCFSQTYTDPAMTRYTDITFLLMAAGGLAILAAGAIFDWSNGAVGTAIIAAGIIIGLARESRRPPRSSH